MTEQITVEKVFGDNLEREVEVRGQCMRFLIEDGETVIVRRVKPKILTIGDIVVLQKDKRFLLHRIIYKGRKNGRYMFVTKGDAYFSFDSPIEEEQILGKVVTIKKSIGPINLTTSGGKLLSYSIGIYSFFIYLMIKFLDNVLCFPLNIFSLFHQIFNRLAEIKPTFFSFLNLRLNRLSGSIFSIVYSGKKTYRFIFEQIPKFFSSFLVYYFSDWIPPKELKKTTKNHFNTDNLYYVQWIELGLNELERTLVEKYFQPGKKVLVVGCNAGRESFALAKKGLEVTGIDVADMTIKKANELNRKRNLPVEFRVMDAQNLEFKNDLFDYAVIFDMTLLRMKERIDIFKEVNRVVKDGGKLLVWTYHESGYIFYLFLKGQGILLPKWMAMLIDSFVTIFFDLPKTFLGLNLRDRYMVKVLVHCYSKKKLAKEMGMASWEIIEIGRRAVSFSGFDEIRGRVKLDYCVAEKSENKKN